MSQFMKRNMLLREINTPNIGASPEVQPGQNLQGILWSAHMQGGDIIRLGPYTYNIQKTITVPENVTLVGVPRLSKLVLRHVAVSSQYGPVVKLNTKSRLVDCYIDLILATDYKFDANTDGIVDPTTTRTGTGDTSDNCVVLLAGVNARIERCFIPTGKRRAILVEANDCIVSHNEIDYPDSSSGGACIYLDTTVAGTIVVGNWCQNTTHGDILYKDPAVSGVKNVVGGLIGGSMNGLMNYANVAEY